MVFGRMYSLFLPFQPILDQFMYFLLHFLLADRMFEQSSVERDKKNVSGHRIICYRIIHHSVLTLLICTFDLIMLDYALESAAVDFHHISTILFYSSPFIVQLYLSPFVVSTVIDFSIISMIIKAMGDRVLYSFDMFLISSSRFR